LNLWLGREMLVVVKLCGDSFRRNLGKYHERSDFWDK
jgi:hypothetical protein